MSWLSYGEGDSSEKSILYFFFLSSRNVGQLFAVFNCTSCLVPLSDDQMKTKMNAITVVMKPWSGDFK